MDIENVSLVACANGQTLLCVSLPTSIECNSIVSLDSEVQVALTGLLQNWSKRYVHQQRLQIPALCSRWSQGCINRKNMFGHDGIDDENLFKLVDNLLLQGVRQD